jgi:predicted LPLAT superfamily acyltransferase
VAGLNSISYREKVGPAGEADPLEGARHPEHFGKRYLERLHARPGRVEERSVYVPEDQCFLHLVETVSGSVRLSSHLITYKRVKPVPETDRILKTP